MLNMFIMSLYDRQFYGYEINNLYAYVTREDPF